MRILLFSGLLFLLSCSEVNSDDVTSPVTENKIHEQSIITCPHCGFEKLEKLPTEYCLFRYTCDSCSNTITPKDGDCCVFCSYGTHECPSIQEENL